MLPPLVLPTLVKKHIHLAKLNFLIVLQKQKWTLLLSSPNEQMLWNCVNSFRWSKTLNLRLEHVPGSTIYIFVNLLDFKWSLLHLYTNTHTHNVVCLYIFFIGLNFIYIDFNKRLLIKFCDWKEIQFSLSFTVRFLSFFERLKKKILFQECSVVFLFYYCCLFVFNCFNIYTISLLLLSTETTHSRVMYFSLFSMLCLLSLATWQVFYLRRYFKAKKLIE